MNMYTLDEGIVFLVDDDDAVRDSLGKLLHAHGLKVKTFRDGIEFLAFYTEEHPGCLLLDMAMPGMTGLEVQVELKRRGLHIPVLFLTGHADVPKAVKAVQQGAMEFLEKPVRAERLLEHIRNAFSREAERRQDLEKSQAIMLRYEKLTGRERQIMAEVVTGISNKNIAKKLGISPRTVEVHRTNVMNKMMAANLAELVKMSQGLATHPLETRARRESA